MRDLFEIPGPEIMPTPMAILEQQGVPVAAAGESLLAIATAAARELAACLNGRAIVTSISESEFASLYEGAGRNDSPSPLAEIFPRAEGLFLFAVTCGRGVTQRIANLFAVNDFPLAAALDAAASLAADRAAEWIQDVATRDHHASTALRYSPGYCGWHISGQSALFATLLPEDIGLNLTPSFLMDPLKSVSGVIVLGPPEIHQFKMEYSFCTPCVDRQCRERIASLSSPTELET